MFLRKLRSISLAILVIGATGSFGVWAHWPSAGSKPSTRNHGAVPALAPERGGTPAGEAGPAQSPSRSQTAADDVRLTDCPASDDDCVPPYCPMSMAANAFSKVVGYFHSSGPSQ